MRKGDPLFVFLRSRRSIRRFRNEPVEDNLLARLIEAATWAPSAGNRQDWFFDVVTSPDVKRKLGKAVDRRWREIIRDNRDSGYIEEVERYAAHFASFVSAPVAIIVSARRPDSFQCHLLGEDASATTGSACSAAMAAQNLMLAAHALGLGTCCMTGAVAARTELAAILETDAKREIVCLIALGWPDEEPAPPQRRPVKEIARFWK
jgi:coenzyme F420-0:L-glutamate ligase / coenzyme F420-1:gamma-L-glutamate ligase